MRPAAWPAATAAPRPTASSARRWATSACRHGSARCCGRPCAWAAAAAGAARRKRRNSDQGAPMAFNDDEPTAAEYGEPSQSWADRLAWLDDIRLRPWRHATLFGSGYRAAMTRWLGPHPDAAFFTPSNASDPQTGAGMISLL